MQRELTWLFTVAMPVLLVSTGIYVCFSMAACLAAKRSRHVDAFFASSLAKSLPYVLIAFVVGMLR